MEKRKSIKIDKLSGTSIGSILCILYKMDQLEYASNVYKYIRNYYKNKYANDPEYRLKRKIANKKYNEKKKLERMNNNLNS